jgi:hypothetical protein
MSAQIFKKNVPNELLFELLESICVKNEKYYFFNSNSFKKGVFSNQIENFFINCKPYYHISKHKYLEKKVQYNTFTTILRQICNFNKITYTSQIKYDKSTYDINYYIYFTNI